MKKITYAKGAAIALVCATGLSVAEEAQLEEVTVVADAVQTSANEARLAPITVVATADAEGDVVISQTELDNSLANNPRDLFRQTPGVELERVKSGGLGDIKIRGMGGVGSGMSTGQNRVTINVDGVPLPDTFSYAHVNSNTRSTYDIADLKQVNVTKGASTATGGDNGVSGTVNFTTKDPVDYLQDGKSFGGNVRVGYNGYNDGASLGASVAGQFSDNFSAMLSYTGRKFHEVERLGGLDVPGPARTASNPVDADSHNIMSKLVYKANENHEFKLKMERYHFDYNETALNDRMPRLRMLSNSSKSRRTLLSLSHDFHLHHAAFDEGSWRAFYQKTNQGNDNKAGGVFAGSNTRYAVKGFGLSANFKKQLSNHLLSYGADYRHTNTSVSDYWGARLGNFQFQPDTTTKLAKLYLKDDIAFADGRFHLIPAIEFIRYQIAPKSTANYRGAMTKIGKNAFNWQLGATFDINDNHQLFASYASGTRAPSFAEQNSLFVGHSMAVPNPNLKPESNNSFEMGLKSHGRLGNQTLTAFHDSYQDMIETKRIDRRRGQFYNLSDDVVLYGLEYQGVLNLGELGLPQGLKLKGDIAYTKGKNKFTDQPYTHANPVNGSIGLAYDAPSEQWGAQWTTHFAKGKAAKDLPATRQAQALVSPGYGFSDLTAYYKPIKNMQINAGVYNIFDKRYATWSQRRLARSFDTSVEPGRTFAVNFKYDF